MNKEPKPPLTLQTFDVHDTLPDYKMIGTLLKHQGNGKVYQVLGFCWLGATDEWGYLHSEVRTDGTSSVMLARPLHHIEGDMSDGTPRYVQVDELEN